MKNDIRTYAEQEVVHCRELSTGKQKTGRLRIGEDKISLKAISYDGYFHLSSVNPVIVQTEDGDVVSLFGNYEGSTGTRYSNADDAEEVNTIHYCDITSNIAIVGTSRWTSQHAIKRITFCMPDMDDLLSRTPEFKKIKTQNMTKQPYKYRLFSARSREFIVRCECGLFWNFIDTNPVNVEPFWEIEFREGASIDGALDVVGYLRAFISLLLGRRLKVTNFRIGKHSRSSISRWANKEIYKRDWDLYCPNFEKNGAEPRPNKEDRSEIFHGDFKISDIKANLMKWMDRKIEWGKSAQLMLSSLDRWNEDSGERMLCASRWLQQLPNSQSERAINEVDTNKIAKAATASALQLGYNGYIENRVSKAVAMISEESHRERFNRLKSMVERRFGSGVTGKHFVDDLVNGIGIRGRAAHDLFMFKDDQKYQNALRGMHATEILCVLLTCLELPLSADGAARIEVGSRLQYYRSLYVTPPDSQ